MSETNIVNEIIIRLSQRGVVSFRNNSGGAYNPNGRFVNYSLSDGASDILGFITSRAGAEISWLGIGRIIFIEAKTEKEYLFLQRNYDRIKYGAWARGTKNDRLQRQIIFIEGMREQGAIAFFSFSADDAEEKLLMFQK